MPSRNALKTDLPDSYYHIYSRGVNKAPVFHTTSDYVVFLSLLKRYLSKNQESDSDGKVYPHFYDKVNLLAYCLMPNHFHLLVFQRNQGAMPHLMRSLLTSYSMYFNKKYKRTGPVFEGRYKASLVKEESYLTHISRYIHLNPDNWQTYHYSSLPYFLNTISTEWIKPQQIMNLFASPKEYVAFLADYQNHKEHLELIKNSLADA